MVEFVFDPSFISNLQGFLGGKTSGIHNQGYFISFGLGVLLSLNYRYPQIFNAKTSAVTILI